MFASILHQLALYQNLNHHQHLKTNYNAVQNNKQNNDFVAMKFDSYFYCTSLFVSKASEKYFAR